MSVLTVGMLVEQLLMTRVGAYGTCLQYGQSAMRALDGPVTTAASPYARSTALHNSRRGCALGIWQALCKSGVDGEGNLKGVSGSWCRNNANHPDDSRLATSSYGAMQPHTWACSLWRVKLFLAEMRCAWLLVMVSLIVGYRCHAM